MEHNIKRSAMIIGWQTQVENGALTWDDVIKACAMMGCNGIELLGSLFFHDVPSVNQDDLKAWNDLMFKYGTKTICHNFFVDMTMYNHRRLTVREAVDIVRRHAEFSKALNCPIIKVGGIVPAEVFRQSAPILEDLGIKMGIEIHNGSSSFCLPEIQSVIDVIRETGSPALGIVPDLSIFALRHGYQSRRNARANNIDPEFEQMIYDTYEKVSNEEFRAICTDYMDKTTDDGVRAFLAMARRVEYWDPKILLEHMPYTFHIHGKFYDITEDCEEPTIDYPNVLRTLVEGGYNGYISAEYEGAAKNGDCFEAFRRYQKMLDKYLGKAPEGNWNVWPDSSVPTRAGGAAGTSDNLCPEGFKNHYDENGNCDGFCVNVRNFYYRGVPLALFEDAHVSVDGEIFGPDKMRVAIDGEVFKFEDMVDVTLHYWNKREHATLIVDKPGGLAPGKHMVAATTVVRAYYMREGIAGQVKKNELHMPPEHEMELEV